MTTAMRHGPACRDGLDVCDWPACYVPTCVRCGADLAEFPLFYARNSAVTGPYCDTCAPHGGCGAGGCSAPVADYDVDCTGNGMPGWTPCDAVCANVRCSGDCRQVSS